MKYTIKDFCAKHDIERKKSVFAIIGTKELSDYSELYLDIFSTYPSEIKKWEVDKEKHAILLYDEKNLTEYFKL
jgi:hypothetical protein